MSSKASLTREASILELVGPAGAGKTSLLRAVGERDSMIRAGFRLRRLSHIPAITIDAILLLPIFFSYYRSGRNLDWLNIKRIILLNAFGRLLGRQAAKGCHAIVLDEGPVFLMTWLHAFAHPAGETTRFRKWSESILAEWSERLDAIIWLDAPDEVLASRIRYRAKPHRVKEKNDQEIYDFISRYRASYEQVISRLETGRGPRVIRISTAEKSTDRIADEVIAEVSCAARPESTTKSSKGLTERAFLNAISSFLDYTVKVGVTLVITPLLVSKLGSSLYGVWQMLGRTVTYMQAADGRPTQALKWIIANQQGIDDPAVKRRHVGSALGVWLLFLPLIATVGALLVYFAPTITRVPPESFLAVRITCGLLVLDFLLINLVELPEAVLRGMNLGYKRMGLVAGLNVIGGLFTVTALYIGSGIVGIAAANVALSVVTGILFWVLVKSYVSWFGIARPSLKEVRAFMSLSVWWFAWTVLSKLLLASDIIVLGVVASTTTVAVYSLSSYAGRTLLTTISMILGAVAPGLGKVIGLKQFEKAAALRSEMMTITWLFATAIGATILLWNRSFVSLWVGADHHAGVTVDLLIVLLMVQLVFVRNDTYVIDLTLQLKKKVVMGAVSVVLSIALSYLLIPRIGIAGLCLGLLAGRMVLSVSYPALVNSYLERSKRIPFGQMARPALAMGSIFAGSLYLSRLLLATNWLEWLAGVATSFALALSLAFVTGLSGDSRKRLIDRLKVLPLFRR
ncbi:MAG TPA: hypothetical protein VJQ56_10950 [Blastocatellia bacterium]|nr:hypothetical protein [Blastocatellia bacterium]